MEFTQKSESLAEKMNRLTETFGKHIKDAEELHVAGSDVIDLVHAKTKQIELYTEDSNEQNIKDKQYYAPEIVNLDAMVSDFKYVRETLKENIENGRRVLNSVTLDLLGCDDDTRASLIVAFAELNKAIADNTKIYISSYKHISDILLNLDKVKKKEQEVFEAKNNPKITNNLTINSSEAISTVDLIKQLSNIKK